jgi:hypothetical protein
MSNLNEILNQTIKFFNENSLRSFHCKCNSIENDSTNSMSYSPRPSTITRKNFEKRSDELCPSLTYVSSASSSLSSASSSLSSASSLNVYQKISANAHKPSQEFLIKCIHLIQDLFEVNCYKNVPTKLNELYYKLGQLMNFRNAIQNIFEPSRS